MTKSKQKPKNNFPNFTHENSKIHETFPKQKRFRKFKSIFGNTKTIFPFSSQKLGNVTAMCEQDLM